MLRRIGDVGLAGWRSGRAGRRTAPARRPRRRACPPGPARRRRCCRRCARRGRPGADVADQGGGGRLAVGAGDGDDLRAACASGAAFTARAKSSMSPMISTPAALAVSTVQCGSGWVSGTPGDSTRAAKLRPVGGRAGRRARSPRPRRPRAAVGVLVPQRRPRRRRPSARARRPGPVRARPNTATVLPSKPRTGIMACAALPYRSFRVARPSRASMIGDDPEADHHGRLRPAELLEMVVDRGHQEDALAGALEVGDLDHHRERSRPRTGRRRWPARSRAWWPPPRRRAPPPSASEPVSPMKILAGGALYQRKPRPDADHGAAEHRDLADARARSGAAGSRRR